MQTNLAKQEPRPGANNILLIEDEAADAALLQRALEIGGLFGSVAVIRDGRSAIEFLSQHSQSAGTGNEPLPDLILLDLKLPKVSGFEVLQKIKSTDLLKRIPVVVLTSSSDPKDVNHAYDLGANSYLVKPVEFSTFTETAQQIKQYWLFQNKPAATIQ